MTCLNHGNGGFYVWESWLSMVQKLLPMFFVRNGVHPNVDEACPLERTMRQLQAASLFSGYESRSAVVNETWCLYRSATDGQTDGGVVRYFVKL